MMITIPEDVLTAMRLPEEDRERVLKVELAVALYQRGILSLGKARKLAGMTKWEFIEELARRGVRRHYSGEELEEDLTFAEGR